MKILYLLSVILLLQSDNNAQRVRLKYPSVVKATIYDSEPGKTSFKLTWDPVEDWDEQDPIIGYKVVVWEMKTEKKLVNKTIDGDVKEVPIEDDSSPAKVPVGAPKIFIVSPDKLEVAYGYMKPKVWYEYAALAYTKNGEGPLSPIWAIWTFGQSNSTENKMEN